MQKKSHRSELERFYLFICDSFMFTCCYYLGKALRRRLGDLLWHLNFDPRAFLFIYLLFIYVYLLLLPREGVAAEIGGFTVAFEF